MIVSFAAMIAVLAPTAAHASAPYMGVDTWYAFGAQIDEANVVQLVDATATSGLERAGYRYIWLDAGWWEGARNADGSISVDPSQWPHGMAWLAAYIHSRGFRAGIYEETGDTACRSGGALGHVQQDINTFAAWGFDAVKVDYCGDEASLLRNPRVVYGQFEQAIADDQPHRPIMLNACDPDVWSAYPLTSFDAWSYAPELGAGSWRTSTDLSWPGGVSWAHLLRNIDDDARHPAVAGNGHWNDPDYLAPTLFSGAQARAQFTMWAILAAPMMLSANVNQLPPWILAMATNREMLAISQDPRGVQGRAVERIGQVQAWVKPLANGYEAVALLDRGARAERVTVQPRTLGLRGILAVRDVWTGKAWSAKRITLTVSATSARLLLVSTALA